MVATEELDNFKSTSECECFHRHFADAGRLSFNIAVALTVSETESPSEEGSKKGRETGLHG